MSFFSVIFSGHQTVQALNVRLSTNKKQQNFLDFLSEQNYVTSDIVLLQNSVKMLVPKH